MPKVQLVPADMTLEFCKSNSETVFSQTATDPTKNEDDCTGIGCWLTEKRQISEFGIRFAKLQCHVCGNELYCKQPILNLENKQKR
jgi:hypothetical protein